MRIFVLMLAGVVLAQALNFVLLVTAPTPPPSQHMLAGVVATLRTGLPAPGFDVAVTTKPPPNNGPQERLRVNRQWLVDALGVDESLVRLDLRGPRQQAGADLMAPPSAGQRPPPPGGDRPPADGYRPPPPDGGFGGAHPVPPMPLPAGMMHRDDAIIGDFSAALKLPSGEWRVVQPAGGGLRGWYLRMFYWLIAGLGVVVPLAWWLARWLAGPIAMFAQAAEQLGRDPGAPALPTHGGPPEVRAAATAFNQMQERLRRYVEDRTMMVAAIAHDLRTPLARLAFRLEEAPDAVREAAAGDIAEMREMIAATLSLVKDMSQPVTRTRIDLLALLQRQTKASRQMGEPVTDGPMEPAWVEGDASGIARMVDNLIGNAVTYGQSVTVCLTVERDSAIIQVLDDGPGIPDALLERVFEPFFRLEPSRNRHTGGAGLGLASARAVARAHGGDLTLYNRPEGGLRAQATLPLHRTVR
ncbi:ATP-binding protein [Niveispirillum lacus]|uniref:ATP-binding protein n=1 Tax=Niveispirillum lacus TaxID=1981099 RepID=UPI001FE461FB|nr:ATP-binding protein [Niveispirillum lacus]